MKKFTALVVISMFALAACQPLNLTAFGEAVDAAALSPNEPSLETEDSSNDSTDASESNSSDSSSSESSDAMEMESSSEKSDSQYSVDVWLENSAIVPEQLTLHEGSVITWTNNDTVAYTISIMKMDDSSDDSMDDTMDDSYDDSGDDSYDDSMDDSAYSVEYTVEPGQTISITLPDSGLYQFLISGGLVSLSGTINVSDSESDDSYDDDMDDSMDDSYDDSDDDMYDDSSDDMYDDSSDDSYDDSSDDSYDDDDYEDGEDEEDSHSSLFLFLA